MFLSKNRIIYQLSAVRDKKRGRLRALPVMFASAAGVAIVLAAAVHGTAAAVCAVMYPNDDDGDDHHNPECLIIGEKAAAIAVAGGIIAVVVAVHKRGSLLNRFLTPYYSFPAKV